MGFGRLLWFSLDWWKHVPAHVMDVMDALAPAARPVHDTLRLRDGTAVFLRAARRSDRALIQDFVGTLSVRSRYHRFFSPIHSLSEDLLDRFTSSDPHGRFSVLAFILQEGREVPVAMAQYVAEPYPLRADFAVVVADAWQRTGLGRKMVETLICVARTAGIEQLEGDVLAENEPMRGLMRVLGFRTRGHGDGPELRKVMKDLTAGADCGCREPQVLMRAAGAAATEVTAAG